MLKERTDRVVRGAGSFALSTVKVPAAFLPLVRLIVREEDIDRAELTVALDDLFRGALQASPVRAEPGADRLSASLSPDSQ